MMQGTSDLYNLFESLSLASSTNPIFREKFKSGFKDLIENIFLIGSQRTPKDDKLLKSAIERIDRDIRDLIVWYDDKLNAEMKRHEEGRHTEIVTYEKEIKNEVGRRERELCTQKAHYEEKLQVVMASHNKELESQKNTYEEKLCKEKQYYKEKLNSEKNGLQAQKGHFDVKLQSVEERYEEKLQSMEERLQSQKKHHEERYEVEERHHKELIEQERRYCRDKIADERRCLQLQLKVRHWNAGGRLKGSTTRSKLWEDQEDRKRIEPLMIYNNNYKRDPTLASLIRTKYRNEKAMYQPTYRSLNRLMDTKLHAKLFVSHDNHYLGGYAPDLSISLPCSETPDPTAVIAVIELKHMDENLGSEAKGQLLDYLLTMRDFQRHRRYFIGILSNFRSTYVMVIQQDHDVVLQSNDIMFDLAIFYLFDKIKLSDYRPTPPKFSPDLGCYRRRYGHGISDVAEFPWNEGLKRSRKPFDLKGKHAFHEIRDTIIVKRQGLPDNCPSLDIDNEVKFLRQILDAGGHQNLPRIIFCDRRRPNLELAIVPVGEPVHPHDFHLSESPDFIPLTVDVLSALEFLHKQHIIHRDVRWDNIVRVHDNNNNPRGILIDLGTATIEGEEVKHYNGGCLCVPEELIGKLDTPYTPVPKDDLRAWVLLIHTGLFPWVWGNFWSRNVREEDSRTAMALAKWWESVESQGSQSLWNEWIRLADMEDHKNLRKLPSNIWISVYE